MTKIDLKSLEWLDRKAALGLLGLLLQRVAKQTDTVNWEILGTAGQCTRATLAKESESIRSLAKTLRVTSEIVDVIAKEASA